MFVCVCVVASSFTSRTQKPLLKLQYVLALDLYVYLSVVYANSRWLFVLNRFHPANKALTGEDFIPRASPRISQAGKVGGYQWLLHVVI